MLMPPNEVHALRELARSSKLVAVLGCVVMLLAMAAALGSVFGDADSRQHHLGQSHLVLAQVTQVSEKGPCTRRSQTYRYTLEWDEGGRHRVESVSRCGGEGYGVDDVVPVWSTDGRAFTQSPSRWWLALCGIALTVGGISTVFVVRARRVRRAVAHALAGADPVRVFDVDDGPWAAGITARRLYPTDTSTELTHVPPGRFLATTVRGGRARGLTLHISESGVRTWYDLK